MAKLLEGRGVFLGQTASSTPASVLVQSTRIGQRDGGRDPTAPRRHIVTPSPSHVRSLLYQTRQNTREARLAQTPASFSLINGAPPARNSVLEMKMSG